MDARNLNLITGAADHVRSDTYTITYGRASGLVPTPNPVTPTQDDINTALADTVDAYRSLTRLARIRPNTSQWRAAARTYRATATIYSNMTGIPRDTVGAKVRTIIECFA